MLNDPFVYILSLFLSLLIFSDLVILLSFFITLHFKIHYSIHYIHFKSLILYLKHVHCTLQCTIPTTQPTDLYFHWLSSVTIDHVTHIYSSLIGLYLGPSVCRGTAWLTNQRCTRGSTRPTPTWTRRRTRAKGKRRG